MVTLQLDTDTRVLMFHFKWNKEEPLGSTPSPPQDGCFLEGGI